jgi:hypothetical protein
MGLTEWATNSPGYFIPGNHLAARMILGLPRHRASQITLKSCGSSASEFFYQRFRFAQV